MREVASFIILSGAILLTPPAKAELREFKTPDGKSVMAEIVGYNAKLGKVELKRENGKRVKVKPSVFVEEDQQYITDWGSLENFRNESSFKVDCKKSILEKWREDSDVHQRGYTRMAYEILLENKSAQALSDLKVEYRVYYDKERNNNSTKKVDTIPSILPGSMEIQVVPPSQKISKTTHSIVLEKYSYNISDYYRVDGADPESTQDELRGIWIRLTLESDSGQRVVRDLCEPSSVRKKYTWSDAPATSNKKEKRRKKGNRR